MKLKMIYYKSILVSLKWLVGSKLVFELEEHILDLEKLMIMNLIWIALTMTIS